LRPSGAIAMKFPGPFGMSIVAPAAGGELVKSTGVICPAEPDWPALTTNAVWASGEIATPKPPVPPVATAEPATFEPKSIGVAELDANEASVTKPCQEAASTTAARPVATAIVATATASAVSLQLDIQ
jgi:hypothetical protein